MLKFNTSVNNSFWYLNITSLTQGTEINPHYFLLSDHGILMRY